MYRFIIGVIGILSLSSCINTQKTNYFSYQGDSAVVSNTTPPVSTIDNNDILSINVTSANPASTIVFNAPNQTAAVSSAANGLQQQASGYLVNTDGNIQFPVLGNVKAKGLTTMQLKDQLTKTLVDQKLLVDPVVTVRQLNFRVSVLGEVNRPTVINVPNEQISLLEALGYAGDITMYGKKEKVMVIRQENGKKVIKRLNLNSNELFTSPVYYLKSNDVVYVETGKSRLLGTSSTVQILPIVLGALSIIAIVVTNIN